MTLVCVPITVEVEDGAAGIGQALADARRAAELGAEVIEWRLDHALDALLEIAPDAARSDAFDELVAGCPVRSIVTCRPAWEGGAFEGPEEERLALFERFLGGAGLSGGSGGAGIAPRPAFVDIELETLGRHAAFRARARSLAGAEGAPRVIVSMHDFEGRPADLSRKLAEAYAEPTAAIVKVAFRARSLRDNLELFEILTEAPKPTIALGMGEFGLMSRVLAPKFGGFLTFASLRDESATAPGQPTIEELLGLYRFRSIGKSTAVYGVIGWPVGHSLSPLVHNAGFEEVGHDGAYLPMPIAAGGTDVETDYASFKATFSALLEFDPLWWSGVSITIPFKETMQRFVEEDDDEWTFGDEEEDKSDPWSTQEKLISQLGAINTAKVDQTYPYHIAVNTDVLAIRALLERQIREHAQPTVCVVGAGGVARAAALVCSYLGAAVEICARTTERARGIAREIGSDFHESWEGTLTAIEADQLVESRASLYINCTPVGMSGGPDPEGLSIPIPAMKNLPPDAVFFDTVYNPVETPMLKAAKERGFRTIDGVEMFVRQAAAQFELWTGHAAPIELFDRLCREKLAGESP